VVISQREICWADLPPPAGSGFRRPVVVVQGDALNGSRIATVVCVALTTNLKWAAAPGNVQFAARPTGLPKDSAANVSQIVTADKAFPTSRVGKLPRQRLAFVGANFSSHSPSSAF
jgi:mRNA interferase MazF